MRGAWLQNLPDHNRIDLAFVGGLKRTMPCVQPQRVEATQHLQLSQQALTTAMALSPTGDPRVHVTWPLQRAPTIDGRMAPRSGPHLLGRSTMTEQEYYVARGWLSRQPCVWCGATDVPGIVRDMGCDVQPTDLVYCVFGHYWQVGCPSCVRVQTVTVSEEVSWR